MTSDARFKHIELQTHRLLPLLTFFRDTLETGVASRNAHAFTVQIGATSIQFTHTSTAEPVYHLAFNIPDNQIEAALHWLASRVEVVRPGQTDTDIVNWPAWNARSVYFRDVAGNILEVIARRGLANGTSGTFSAADLLCVSEVGLVVPDPHATAELLSNRFSLPKRSVMQGFAAVGDDHGMFIISAPNRPWMPTKDLLAAPFPAHVLVRYSSSVDLQIPGTQYHIVGTPEGWRTK